MDKAAGDGLSDHSPHGTLHNHACGHRQKEAAEQERDAVGGCSGLRSEDELVALFSVYSSADAL